MASHGIPRVSGASLDKSEQAKQKERKQIDQYKALESEVTDRIKARDYSNATFQATSKLLSQNPEYYTIWNHRRRLLQDVFARELATGPSGPLIDETDAAAAQKAGLTLAQHEIALLVKEDLLFLIPLLKQYPKCYWIWNHRSWLLSTATQHLPVHNSSELWQGELGLVTKMLSLDSRNFHGWGYRRQVVKEIEQLNGSSMAESEFTYTTKMVETNLSNFSAWHNRSQLIPRILSDRQASSKQRQTFFDSEFELITRALYTDPYDQSLWFYHQYLMATLDASNDQALPILDPCTNTGRVDYLEREIDSIKEMLEGAEDCKYIYQALLEYSSRYIEVEAGNKKVSTVELREWLDELRKLDPLRAGRWRDWQEQLKL
ncbi:hypothetical protein BAUCODRAFT_148226 [Baudoinia panamericana UAMH 10762]|uniref:Geranylgeranyl transferase type-2 subunit alpha n=1 Tax=Baudoinia panamericana (strain UAMH 10762) TaxID=717646 RepID=M2MJ06_BAUPA|nr:uncharacterized protein BAUCODRAFT_148226 [Baudoinia panamericana UAMH 10762]EMC96651.1 hypothetical protein BAUCODRAFT_148226 [Baudoinia panamericana UAMH 10762]